MSDAAPIIARYAAALADSNPWVQSASPLAGNATHDSWGLDPFPVVFERAEGVHKWDVAGRQYLDLWMGHGALLFGNAYPPVVEAVVQQVRNGQHLGGAHVLHYEWAERIQRAMPACEAVRFTASGTEATLLALRIARAATERSRILRVDGHFHGWHEEALVHAYPARRAGFRPGPANDIALLPPLEVGVAAEELEEGDVAALILEPGGGSAGCLPWSPEYLSALRRLTRRHGALLIFDEVISGFRYHPGGVQALAGVSPDITVLAKIAAGGMPGGIVGGRLEVMSVLGQSVVPHSGTFNGSPLSAAAACVTLDAVRDGAASTRAQEATGQLVAGINEVAAAADVDVRAFHQSSIFHLMIGAVGDAAPVAPGPAVFRLRAKRGAEYHVLRLALLMAGIDCHSSHGWLSSLHEPYIVAEAIDRFATAFASLREVAAFRPTASLQPSALPEPACTSVCHQPTCGSRFRTVAGCSLPLYQGGASDR